MSDHPRQQEILQAVKDLAIELGRSPFKQECRNRIRGYRHFVQTCYGDNHAIVLQACGLDPALDRARLKSNVFERDIVDALNSHEPREMVPQETPKRTLCIGDAHFPFVNQRALDFVYEFAVKNKPERIIQVGDLYDLYAYSKFPKSMNVYRPEEEIALAQEMAKKMWKEIKSIAPQAQCVQLKGNHDVRPIRRTLESLPALEHVISRYIDEIMTFDGVTLIADSRQEFMAEGVQYIHGYRPQLGSHRDYAMMNTVCGHSHKGGTVFRRFRGQTFWELNCGFIGDAESKALSYSSQKIHDCTTGLGWIDEDGPRFIPTR